MINILKNSIFSIQKGTLDALLRIVEQGEEYSTIKFFIGLDGGWDTYEVYKTSRPYEEARGGQMIPTVSPNSYMEFATDEKYVYYISLLPPEPYIEHESISFEKIPLSQDNLFVQEDDYTRIAIIGGNIYYCLK